MSRQHAHSHYTRVGTPAGLLLPFGPSQDLWACLALLHPDGHVSGAVVGQSQHPTLVVVEGEEVVRVPKIYQGGMDRVLQHSRERLQWQDRE